MDNEVTRRRGGEAPTISAKSPPCDPRALGVEVLVAALVRGSQDGVFFLDRDLRCVYACPTACVMLGCGLDKLQGRDCLTWLDPEQPVGQDQLAAVFGGTPARWETVLRRPDGSELDVVCTATGLESESRELMMVVLRDVSEQRRQAREAAALAQAAVSAAGDSIEATVQSLAESVLRGTRALGASVVLDDGDDLAAWIGAASMPDGFADSVRDSVRARPRPDVCFPREAGSGADLYQSPVTEQRMVVDRDLRRRLESDPTWEPLNQVLKSIPWQAAVAAPLIYQARYVGMLSAIFQEGELPSEGEMAFLGTLADQAAVVAMNARLMTAARDKVALEERQRLARELHDSVSQALYGIALGARTARDRLECDPASVAEPIDYVLQLAEAGLAEMRALIFELRPEALETEGLVGALEKQVEAVRARHGISARTAGGQEPDSPFEVKQALYRIAQEALQNTVKHARARRIEVCLEAQDGEVRLSIEDDGVGFEAGGSFPGHLGLRSMRERALGVGGSLEVVSTPGHGTRILVSVPLRPEAHAAIA